MKKHLNKWSHRLVGGWFLGGVWFSGAGMSLTGMVCRRRSNRALCSGLSGEELADLGAGWRLGETLGSSSMHKMQQTGVSLFGILS